MSRVHLVIPDGYSVKRDGTCWQDGQWNYFKTRWGGIGKRWLKKKMLTPTPDSQGYLKISFGVSFCAYVHRLVAVLYIENPDNLPQVNHKDGDKTNNSVSNLEWIDQSGNMSHASQLGLVGGFYGKQKLPRTKEKLEEIENLVSVLGSVPKVAKYLGMSHSSVYRFLKDTKHV